MKVIEDRKELLNHEDRFNPLLEQSGSMRKNIMAETGYSASHFHSFRVISTTSPNCLSLSQIDIKGTKLHKTPLA
jgi:hypothetical protein